MSPLLWIAAVVVGYCAIAAAVEHFWGFQLAKPVGILAGVAVMGAVWGFVVLDVLKWAGWNPLGV
jgi:hypothetical protein